MIHPARALGLALVVFVGCRDQSVEDRPSERLRRRGDAGRAVEIIERSGAIDLDDLPREREPNHEVATANPLGAGVRGELDGVGDVDGFRVDSPEPRFLTARVSGLPEIDLALEVRDQAFALVARADRAGVGAGEGVAGLPLGAGTYVVVVREVPKPPKKGKKGVDAGVGRVGPSATYELIAELSAQPQPGGEREPNGEIASANAILLGEAVTGYLGWTGDVDVWKVDISALTEGNGLDLAVSAVDGVALTLAVLDAAGHPVMKVQSTAGKPVELARLVARAERGGAVRYVSLAGRPPNPDLPYSLTVTGRLLELDEETEPNHRVAQATPLRPDEAGQGSMRATIAPGDTDLFALPPAPRPAMLDLAADAPAGIDLALAVVGARGEVVTKIDAGGPGAAESAAAVPIVGDGAWFIEVTGKPSKGLVDAAPYRLRWSLTQPSAPDPADDPLPPEE